LSTVQRIDRIAMTTTLGADAELRRASQERLMVVTEMDPWSASTRYRALQHVPRLRRLFADVEVLLPNDPVGRAPGRVSQARYFGTHAARYVRRAGVLSSRVARYDALLIQRGLYVVGPGAIVSSLNRFCGRIVFDLDDAVFELSPLLERRGAAARWLYGPQQALKLMRRADAIVVSTPELADALPAGLPAATVLPTVPDPSRHEIVKHEERLPAVIGWAGTIEGLGFLDPLAGVFRRLADDGVATLEVVSSRPWRGPASFHPWKLEEEATVFNRFAIGIMPLPDTEYTRAKAGFKLLQYMASGIPVVCSPIGVNREIVERSGCGLLAQTPADWEEALRTLASQPELRSALGARGRAFVVDYANLDAQALMLTRLLVGPDAGQ
jgi:glycosyltransferase involved in cell wall biosynthesis